MFEKYLIDICFKAPSSCKNNNTCAIFFVYMKVFLI